MTGENGIPETPDWQPTHSGIIRLSRADFEWLMSDDDTPPPRPGLLRLREPRPDDHIVRGTN